MSIKLAAERRLFQAVVYLAALVPILAGAAGAWQGPAMIHRGLESSADLDSHFRYLSGLLLGIGIAFVFAAAAIERRAALFRTLGLVVIAGGLSRLLGVVAVGLPSSPQRYALVMELLVVPALLMWLDRLERRAAVARPAPAS